MGNHLSARLVPETENETMMVKKQICEDIEGVIWQRIGLRSQVLGGSVLILIYLQNRDAPVMC